MIWNGSVAHCTRNARFSHLNSDLSFLSSSLLVIGSKVNMAARLMMNYPSIISCDEETYKAAITKLNKQDFESLPFKTLKGIAEPGVIREYNKNHE